MLGNLDYTTVLGEIRRQIAQSGATNNAAAGIACRVTGVMPLVHEIQQALKRDLFTSFLSDFAMITIVMTIAQGGILTGLLSMVSNFFPTVVMFGILGWVAMPLDIGSVMTASVRAGHCHRRYVPLPDILSPRPGSRPDRAATPPMPHINIAGWRWCKAR